MENPRTARGSGSVNNLPEQPSRRPREPPIEQTKEAPHIPLPEDDPCIVPCTNITKDFNGLPIVFREDGYINMTKAVLHFPGKHLRNFWANEDTQAYMGILAEMSGIPDIKISKRGNGGGTFCHPKLAVFFARWLDVRFAVWCDLMIDNIIHGNIQTTVVVKTKEAVEVDRAGLEMKEFGGLCCEVCTIGL